jgi:hypothetical protein
MGQNISDLLLASQCDSLITGMLNGSEDYAEVPPIDEDGPDAEMARDLLRWALTGAVPIAYIPYVQTEALLSTSVADRITTIAQELKAGLRGRNLVTYGTALYALADW